MKTALSSLFFNEYFHLDVVQINLPFLNLWESTYVGWQFCLFVFGLGSTPGYTQNLLLTLPSRITSGRLESEPQLIIYKASTLHPGLWLHVLLRWILALLIFCWLIFYEYPSLLLPRPIITPSAGNNLVFPAPGRLSKKAACSTSWKHLWELSSQYHAHT